LYLSSTPLFKGIFTEFAKHLASEAKVLKDDTLDKEVDIVDTLVNAMYMPEDMYYESQQTENSCFIHATNMYFQR
jgi:hypothetical protein